MNDATREGPRVHVVRTEDGSETLEHSRLGVTYRSTHGARTESDYIFVGSTHLGGSSRAVLELGFGAATNFARTVHHAMEHDYSLTYVAVEHALIEACPIRWNSVADPLVAQVLEHAHKAGDTVVTACIGEPISIQLEVHCIPWSGCDFGRAFDSVFFDPFGPRINPESWTPGAFGIARDHMHEGSILGTYSAATKVRQAMVAAGLEVASAPGPGRKREVTFAARTCDALDRFEILDRERYS